MGSPEFSLPALNALMAISNVVGVVTQPDRPVGRGRNPAPPPIKRRADELHLPVIQPEKLRSPEAMARLRSWQPDLILVAAFGQILRSDVLNLPRFGCLNLHASLLPRHRGASPVAAAILAGDVETGITLMQMDAGLDTGPILANRQLTILPADTTESLTNRLAILAAETLTEYFSVYIRGQLAPKPQDSNLATYAAQLTKENGRLDARLDATHLERQIRAYTPWPGTFLMWNQTPLKILSGEARESLSTEPEGTLMVLEKFPAVRCHTGILILRTVQLPGKKPTSGKDFLNGVRDFTGNILR